MIGVVLTLNFKHLFIIHLPKGKSNILVASKILSYTSNFTSLNYFLNSNTYPVTFNLHKTRGPPSALLVQVLYNMNCLFFFPSNL